MTEKKASVSNGFLAIVVMTAILAGGVFLLVSELTDVNPSSAMIVVSIILILVALIMSTGIVLVKPNETRVVLFFGRYLGTLRESGLWWTTPLITTQVISIKVFNFNTPKLKVNDVDGNPIEIAAVIVYKVLDTAKAAFDVNSYTKFLETQSESALRYIASRYPYDRENNEEHSLRGDSVKVSQELLEEVQERLKAAGVEVIEARLTHLAYAPEIASAMLQRQQAAAIIAAREKIVEGAIGMVQSAIERLEKDFELDEERKAVMANNLMIAIVSDRGTQPVINTGSLYN
ncbi:SPFH domain-containing protein [Paraliobacillus sp. X-1268]|uniref:SPFH domain-containing protein n=1 Tax=Paraliobacillus sp. X-1268 TaxID=2213193 RepID=UPI000E3C64E5|nr:SPFH domain-containing protein [Paraliobacillus sp. X-1268]